MPLIQRINEFCFLLSSGLHLHVEELYLESQGLLGVKDFLASTHQTANVLGKSP